MRRLAQAPNIAIAALWVDMLRQAGIAASVQRQFLGSAAGELPPDQCLPEIWVTHDEQEGAARQLLAPPDQCLPEIWVTHDEQEGAARQLLAQLQSLPQRRWRCVCGELVEGGFESCWNCGRAMP